MFQRVIQLLKQKQLFTPTAFVLALLLVLSLIIILGQFFHQSLQEEMEGQFNQQQLLLSREVAKNIETFIDHVYKNLRVISQLPEIHTIHDSSRCKSVVESINFNLQSGALITVQILDKNGKLIEELSIEQAQELIRDGTISGGMIPKIEGCIEVVEAGVEAVVIINGKVPHCVLLELLTDHGAGTLVGRRKPKTKKAAE